ncbi:MAG: hypothetical protein H7X70_01655 [Candidatus Kapabacteria bacterium]|nr:hypothetical protein [Candidatus Kapabacteria bacterium]
MIDGHAAFFAGDHIVKVVESVIEELKAVGGSPSPAIILALRGSTEPVVASAATQIIDVALGTMRAERLGKRMHSWLLTDRMAEQCTHPQIAAHHALPFGGCDHVLEICTGAGIDTAALAKVAGRVTSFEADPLVAALATGNIRRAGIQNVNIMSVAWTGLDAQSGEFDAVWADPSRRSSRGRQRSSTGYEPPLDSIPNAEVVGVKVGPGDVVDDHGYESEFIGFGKECRERILWRTPHITMPTVSLVDKSVSWRFSGIGSPLTLPNADYVIEPHNALIASGNVGAFFAEIGAGVFDPKIAYGALNEEPPPSPWYERYKVLRIYKGISVRRIQESIRELGWGPTTIFKKRGWENDPEDLRRALSFASEGPPGVVIIMRVGDGHQSVFAELM